MILFASTEGLPLDTVELNYATALLQEQRFAEKLGEWSVEMTMEEFVSRATSNKPSILQYSG